MTTETHRLSERRQQEQGFRRNGEKGLRGKRKTDR